MLRLAWFSPMPPVATGIARCSAELVPALSASGLAIDVFVDDRALQPAQARRPDGATPIRPAHDFAWMHHQHPYDLIVYQLGNSSHHDYEWPYLFRYPGLAVLHDGHLHHARAACLLRTQRADDYRIEFARNHPGANLDLAELAAAGFDNHLHYAFPMTRLVARRSRAVAVHAPAIADRIREEAPDANISVVRLGHGVELSDEACAAIGRRVRARYGIPADAIVFGCYGGLTPDKRIHQILAALPSTRAHCPSAHVLLGGAIPSQYDLRAEIARLGLTKSCTVTGYLETDEDFTGAIAACDVSLNLRWPTAREISGPWLCSLAAGKPTVTIDLAHTAGIPSLDPRTWQGRGEPAETPCTVAVDIVDEDHSLRLAMRRLATDADLRAALGRSGRRYWRENHSLEAMAHDYRQLIAATVDRDPAPAHGPEHLLPDHLIPDHLINDGSATLRDVMRAFDLPVPFSLRR